MVQLQPQSLSIDYKLPVGRLGVSDKCLAPDRPHSTLPWNCLQRHPEFAFPDVPQARTDTHQERHVTTLGGVKSDIQPLCLAQTIGLELFAAEMFLV